MDHNLQQAIAQMLHKSMELFDKGQQFASEQIPEIIRQYLVWQMIAALLWLPICGVVIFLTYKFVTKWSSQEKYYGDWAISKVLSCVFGGMASLITSIMAITGLFNALEILIAPKVFLLENFVRLIK